MVNIRKVCFVQFDIRKFYHRNIFCLSIPVAVRSKASVFSRSLTGIVGSNPAGVMDVSVVSVVCCQVEVSATG